MKTTTGTCILLLSLWFCWLPYGAEQKPDTARPDSETGRRHIVVYYFHRTIRCPTCMMLEELTKEALSRRFLKEVKAKMVRLEVLNLDLPQNSHFETDYALQYQSVVVSEVVGGKETRWKNLPQIWELVNSPADFFQYIVNEVTDYLKTLK